MTSFSIPVYLEVLKILYLVYFLHSIHDNGLKRINPKKFIKIISFFKIPKGIKGPTTNHYRVSNSEVINSKKRVKLFVKQYRSYGPESLLG